MLLNYINIFLLVYKPKKHIPKLAYFKNTAFFEKFYKINNFKGNKKGLKKFRHS